MIDALRIQPLTATTGAEILGCNLDTADPAELGQIADALHQYGIVVIRGQRIAPAAQVRLAKFLGPIEIPVVSEFLLPEQSEVLVLSNIVENGRPIGATDAGQWWHVDMSYQSPPSRCTLLHAIRIPRDVAGNPLGDTMFANTAAAYQALPPAERARLASLSAVHSHSWRYAQVVRDSGGQRRALSPEEVRCNPDVTHPIVRPHPRTGQPCLYVNEGYTMAVSGMTEEEAKALLGALFAHITQPQFIYRHRWQPDDLVIWDNCLVQHRATGGYTAAQPRRMHRIVVRDVPAAGAAATAMQ